MDIHLDFETFSIIDLPRVGAFRYARHDSTEILVACWAVGNGPVRRWSPYGIVKCDDPEEMFAAAKRGVMFAAHNAQFEYAIWKYVGPRYGFPAIPAQQWRCTAARAAMCSLPRSLDGAARAMDINVRKDPRGKALIRVFCMPQKATKNKAEHRIYPKDQPQDFMDFVDYCADDVVTERELDHVLPAMPRSEQELYCHDILVNERGFRVDVPLIRKAIHVTSHLEADIKTQVRELTGGINPTQRDKLLTFLQLEEGLDIDNLQAMTLERVMKDAGLPMDSRARRIIDLRLEGSRASTKKLKTMLDCSDLEDERVRGSLLINGAHTGRWTGRLVQPHNFIRGLLKRHQQRLVFDLLDIGDPLVFQLLYDKPMSMVAQVMRGFIIAREWHRFIVADYSAIEARILFWLAGEEDALEKYRRGEDLYKWMASKLFKVPIDQVTDEQRRIGKNLILGCGYGLGYKKFIVYCDKQGVTITVEFSQYAVNTYRDQHPRVVSYWRAVNNAAITAVQEKGITKIGPIIFDATDKTFFRIRLPSGRQLFYPFPKVSMVKKTFKNDDGKENTIENLALSYIEEYQGRFIRTSTYGGKLVENIVQAVARDVLAGGMKNVEQHGYPIVLHVHDEIVSERPEGEGSAEEFSSLACVLPGWIEGCPIEAKGFECFRYRKE